MKRQRTSYLNVILTVNAVLLAGLLWTQISTSPPMAQEAVAQQRTKRSATIPNAAEQRVRIIQAIQSLQRSTDATKKLLDSGKLKVEVTNLDEIEVTVEESR